MILAHAHASEKLQRRAPCEKCGDPGMACGWEGGPPRDRGLLGVVPGPHHWDLLLRKLPVGLGVSRSCFDGIHPLLNVRTWHLYPQFVRGTTKLHRGSPPFSTSYLLFWCCWTLRAFPFNPALWGCSSLYVKYGLCLEWDSGQSSL